MNHRYRCSQSQHVSRGVKSCFPRTVTHQAIWEQMVVDKTSERQLGSHVAVPCSCEGKATRRSPRYRRRSPRVPMRGKWALVAPVAVSQSGCPMLHAPRAHARATVSTMMTFRYCVPRRRAGSERSTRIEQKASYIGAKTVPHRETPPVSIRGNGR